MQVSEGLKLREDNEGLCSHQDPSLGALEEYTRWGRGCRFRSGGRSVSEMRDVPPQVRVLTVEAVETGLRGQPV